ncbi:MAG: UPF0489 family protein [Acidobacteriota bacterium]
MTVPLVVTEEHHESLLVWAYAVERGWMAATGHSLLHIDEHADWALPRVDRPLPPSPLPPAETSELVYEQLHIGNFLWVAIHQRLFDRVRWLRRAHQTLPKNRHRRLFVCPVTHDGWRLVTGSCLADGSIPPLFRDEAHAVQYDLIEPREPLEPDENLVLSIDLDYFLSHPSPHHPAHRIEVTADELRRFLDDPYHFLRISPGGHITPHTEDGRHFLIFNRSDAMDTSTRRETAHAAIDQLDGLLGEMTTQPRLITLSRSIRSGYTPPSLAAELEDALLARLKGRYDVEATELEMIWCAADHRGLRRAAEEVMA